MFELSCGGGGGGGGYSVLASGVVLIAELKLNIVDTETGVKNWWPEHAEIKWNGITMYLWSQRIHCVVNGTVNKVENKTKWNEMKKNYEWMDCLCAYRSRHELCLSLVWAKPYSLQFLARSSHTFRFIFGASYVKKFHWQTTSVTFMLIRFHLSTSFLTPTAEKIQTKRKRVMKALQKNMSLCFPIIVLVDPPLLHLLSVGDNLKSNLNPSPVWILLFQNHLTLCLSCKLCWQFYTTAMPHHSVLRFKSRHFLLCSIIYNFQTGSPMEL